MNIKTLLSLTIAPIAFSLATFQTSLAGGYHYQLELSAKLLNNDQKELTAIQMNWTYDKELSAVLMDGEDLSEAKREQTLKKRAADILSGLAEMKYFTSLQLDKVPLEFSEIENYQLRLDEQFRLELNLIIPLDKSVRLNGRILEIIVTDQTGVGLATFIDRSHLQLGEVFEAECQSPLLFQSQLAEINGHAQITETMSVDCR